MGGKHRVLDRADLDRYGLSVRINDRHVLFTGSIRRVGQQFFPAVNTADIGLAQDNDASRAPTVS